jgi:hypothetical protein
MRPEFRVGVAYNFRNPIKYKSLHFGQSIKRTFSSDYIQKKGPINAPPPSIR